MANDETKAENMEEQSSNMNDRPFPAASAYKPSGWSMRPSHYPIFSLAWFRARVLSFALLIMFAAILLIFVGGNYQEVLAPGKPAQFYTSLAFQWLAIFVLVYLGRGLATAVCALHLPEKKKVIGIAAALLFGIAAATTIDVLGENYMVDTLHQTNTTNATNSAQQICVANDTRQSTTQELRFQVDALMHDKKAFNLIGDVVWMFFVAWLGGGADFIAYSRQRRALQDARTRQELAKSKAAQYEAELKLSVLAAQIEPHFLFNTLTGVRSAIVGDPERGVALIDHLVAYLRATIPQMRSDAGHSQVTLKQQLEAIRAYLGVMHARLPRLSYSVACDPALLNQQAPPLMLISLVENAVKHGIEPQPGPARIEVLVNKVNQVFGNEVGEYIELIVSDDGAGFGGATSGSGIGLSNIRARLAQLYGKRAELTLKAGAQGGVVATITIPMAS
jgi:hypothetical protein